MPCSDRKHEKDRARQLKRQKEATEKTPVEPVFSGSQHPLFHINTTISTFQITELGVNHRSVLWTKVSQDRTHCEVR